MIEGRNWTTKSRKYQNVWKRGNLQVLGNIGLAHHQISGNERKKCKIVSQANEKTYRNQTL